MSSVVVVGSINVDHVVAAARLPRAGETVIGPGMYRYGGGKGANAAVAAARVGAHVEFVGAVGADDVGELALSELRAEGVGIEHVATFPGTPTGAAVIVVDDAGENQIAVGAGANAQVTAHHVRTALASVLPGAGCVLVSTEIADDAVAAAVHAAREAGIRCVLNPAPVTAVVSTLLESGPLLTPNRGEAADLAPDLSGLAARTGAPVVVTLGGDGVRIVRPDADPVDVAPREATVIDTTGAGDTFNGVLAAELAAGSDLDAAVAVANTAAALSVGGVGARGGMPTADELAAATEALGG